MNYVHQLLSKHVAEHRMFKPIECCRTLHENYLAGNKWNDIMILNEVYIYVKHCNKKGLIINQKEEKEMYKHASINAKCFNKG